MPSLRAKLIMFWLAMTTLLVSTTHVIFNAALDTQLQQLRQTLRAIAATGALQIDGNVLAGIPPERASLQLPEHQALLERLREIRNANPAIRFVYVMVPTDAPGTWKYLADAEEVSPSLPGDPYDVTRYPAMAAGLERPSADPALTVDEWGALLSGYAPIRTRQGQAVGVLGIDMFGESVVRMQHTLQRWRLVVLLITLFTITVLGVLVVRWVSDPVRQLVRGAEQIGGGDLTYRVPVRAHDEVGRLGDAFNRMAQQLADSVERLRRHVLSTIEALSVALEAKDRYTRGHSARVQHYAVKIAQQMALPADQIELIRQFSALHDIGKIGIAEEILNKPDKLTPEEFVDIRRHPEVGYRILAPLKPPADALAIVRHHHERMDGHGYPDGLPGERIPLSVSIVSVADVFDAITGRRPYRPTSMTFPEAAEELKRSSGTQLRPDVVESLFEVLRKEGKLPPA